MFTTQLSKPCATFKLRFEMQKLLPVLQFLPPEKQAAANSVRPGARNCRVAIRTFLLDLQAFAHQIGKIFQRQAFGHEFELVRVGL